MLSLRIYTWTISTPQPISLPALQSTQSRLTTSCCPPRILWCCAIAAQVGHTLHVVHPVHASAHIVHSHMFGLMLRLSGCQLYDEVPIWCCLFHGWIRQSAEDNSPRADFACTIMIAAEAATTLLLMAHAKHAVRHHQSS